VGEAQPVSAYTARFWHLDNDAGSVLVFEDWLDQETARFVNREPILAIDRRDVRNPATDIVPLVITGLVAFALYLPAFNLFITSTGEEREKRLLLALLLTPARPLELVLAKAIFYALGSLAVSLVVVGLHDFSLVFDVRLIAAILLGSIGYVAIGTVLVSFIRRQTTLSTVSMLYLMGVGTVVSLAQSLQIFNVLRLFLIENFLYSLLQKILSGEPPSREQFAGLIALSVLVAIWLVVAVTIFSRRSKSIAQSR
jgi:ABC-type Na+ efflux pump permease subunit